VLRDDSLVDSYVEFINELEPRLRNALTASLGSEEGKEATAEAVAYGWEHWDRVKVMENPAGYLFVVGRRMGRSRRKRTPVFHEVESPHTPWVEPGLDLALARLPERQRTVVMLLHCFGWSMSEVAQVLGVSKTTVQNHDDRGLKRLRGQLGVEQ
jgi:RNA polymerase sigma-70 factor (ECF subfamily)